MRRYFLGPLLFFVLTGCAQQAAPQPSSSQTFASITSASATTQEGDGTVTVTLNDVLPKVPTFVEGDLQADTETYSLESFLAEWPALFGDSTPNATLLTSQPASGSFSQVAAFQMGQPTYSAEESELTFSATLTEGALEPLLKNLTVNIDLPAAR